MATAIKVLVSERAAPATHAATRPAVAMLLIMMADMMSLGGAILLSAAVRHWFEGNYELLLYLNLWPALGLFVAVYTVFGLYPAVVFNAVTEIRQAVAATTLVYLILASLTFILRVTEIYSRLVFLMAWIISVPLVPLMRTLIRHWFARKPWWGYPVVVLAGGEAGARVVKTLKEQPELGFRVRAVLSEEPGASDAYPVAIQESWKMAPILSSHHSISHAILVVPGLPAKDLLELLDTHARSFSHLYIIPDIAGLSSFGIEVRDLSRSLALEVRNRLLLPTSRVAKRLMDLFITLTVALVTLPFVALIIILIKLDSRGPVFYGHFRLGLHQDRFKVWKFRSMVRNADQVLKEYLAEHPELKAEWERDYKLKNDPRITRIGKLLRKTSLDELPQLWNVLKGEMSLVGPRPIVTAEISEYGARFGLYTQVLPGLTGLWQVSGRNDTTYAERVALDTYYVRNWSPWLDIHVLARTVRVVLKGHGAY